MENLPFLAMAMLKAARKTNPALESMLSSQHQICTLIKRKILSDKIKELEVNSFSNQSVSRLTRKTNWIDILSSLYFTVAFFSHIL